MTKTIADLVNFASSPAATETYATPAEKCVNGSPMQNATTHYSVDDKFFAGEWGAEVGRWRVDYSEHEYFEILSGHSVLHDEAGNSMELKAGDRVCIPAGFRGEWEVIEPTQKVFVIFEP
ncbi:transcriptional regulator [gamma proteobacterium NOR5-3]|nr:transcriptional regulator [gamma proteobacterium NOR5-3]